MQPQQRILIVEDNLDNVSIYTAVLEFSGFEVLCAPDGVTGIKMAREQKPDLILMDVAIPGIDGWEATRTLKADAETWGIPIIVLTAHALERDRLRAFSEGADGYIAKPADPTAVVRAIKRKLEDPDYPIGRSAIEAFTQGRAPSGPESSDGLGAEAAAP